MATPAESVDTTGPSNQLPAPQSSVTRRLASLRCWPAKTAKRHVPVCNGMRSLMSFTSLTYCGSGLTGLRQQL